MKSLNDCVSEYRRQVEKGDIVTAYRGLMEFMMKLRTHFASRFTGYEIPGSIYYGYMDMTYFSVVPEKLKGRGLKIAIVLVHDKLRFEAWLAGRNKSVQLKYWESAREHNWNKYRIPATLKGQDSIIEYELVDNPDFSDPDRLMEQIGNMTAGFIADIESYLERL